MTAANYHWDDDVRSSCCYQVGFFWVKRTCNITTSSGTHLAFIYKGLLLVPNGKYLGSYFGDEPFNGNVSLFLGTGSVVKDTSLQLEKNLASEREKTNTHSWAIIFTVLGTVLLDSMADSCQSPARSYLVDICHPGNS